MDMARVIMIIMMIVGASASIGSTECSMLCSSPPSRRVERSTGREQGELGVGRTRPIG